MGMDPDTCDPVTLDLFRKKFFGSSAGAAQDESNEPKQPKKSKKDKVKISKENNVLDKMKNEDDTALA